VAVLLVAAVLTAVPVGLLLMVASAATGQVSAGSCGQTSSVTPVSSVAGLDAAQAGNARIVIATGVAMGVPRRGLIVAVATARQESGLMPLDHGPDGSLGLFQQIPFWGTAADRMDPVTSSRLFYARLLRVKGWEAMPVTQAAQAVQRSKFGDAYAQWETLATAVVGQSGTAGPVCAAPAVAVAAGNAPQEAARILAQWGDRIVGNAAAEKDLQDTASGAGFESCGHHILIDADLLRWQLLLMTRFALTVVNYSTGHACDPFYHPPGMASDLGGVTEIGSGQSTNFTPGTAGDNAAVDTRFDDFAATVGPDHAALGQLGFSGASSPAYQRIAFPDGPTHRHMNTHQNDPQWGPYRSEVWPS